MPRLYTKLQVHRQSRNRQHNEQAYTYHQGYYSTIEEVVTSLNSLFNNLKTAQKLERVPQFGNNIRKRKCHVDLQPGESLYFKPKLAAMLGITTNPIRCGSESIKYHGEDLFNLDETIHTLYVYCNIMENMPVGNERSSITTYSRCGCETR